jgi:hypothetical protein
MKIPNAHFGQVDQQLDWRKVKTNDVDDDELRKPARSIVDILQLNPLHLFESYRRKDNFIDSFKNTKEDSNE